MGNIDEEGVMASLDGRKVVTEYKGRRKTERTSASSRVSISIVRAGTAAGAKLPSFYLMKGKEARSGYTSGFISRHHAPVGSQIIMTPNSYMTTDVWETIAGPLCDAIRNLPVSRISLILHVVCSWLIGFSCAKLYNTLRCRW